MLRTFWNDDNGAIISAELVLVLTICVISMIVGLTELTSSVVQELNDVGDAIGSVNQSYFFGGFASRKTFDTNAFKAFTVGSVFVDFGDDCDNNQCTITCQPPVPELPKPQ